MSKLRAFAENKVRVTQIIKLVSEKLKKNIVGTGENAANQHFLLFVQYFQLFLPQSCLTHFHTMTSFDAPGKQAF